MSLTLFKYHTGFSSCYFSQIPGLSMTTKLFSRTQLSKLETFKFKKKQQLFVTNKQNTNANVSKTIITDSTQDTNIPVLSRTT